MTRDEVVRLLWAAVLDSKVAKDGQVPGFRHWWDRASDELRRFAHEAELYVARAIANGADVSDVIASESARVKEFALRPREQGPTITKEIAT